MTNPQILPDWVPPWLQLLILIVGILAALAFLMMPFSIFGVKPRLEAIEARLDEIQGEIRALSLRLPERGARPPEGTDREGPAARPPIPPAAWAPDAGPRRPIGATSDNVREAEAQRPRLEPRIDRRR